MKSHLLLAGATASALLLPTAALAGTHGTANASAWLAQDTKNVFNSRLASANSAVRILSVRCSRNAADAYRCTAKETLSGAPIPSFTWKVTMTSDGAIIWDAS